MSNQCAVIGADSPTVLWFGTRGGGESSDTAALRPGAPLLPRHPAAFNTAIRRRERCEISTETHTKPAGGSVNLLPLKDKDFVYCLFVFPRGKTYLKILQMCVNSMKFKRRLALKSSRNTFTSDKGALTFFTRVSLFHIYIYSSKQSSK